MRPNLRPSGRKKKQRKKHVTAVKKRHTLKALVMRTGQKRVVFLSSVQAGAMHDFALRKKLFPGDKEWFKGLTVRADSGFQGFADVYAGEKLFLPHKKPRGKERTPNQKFRNKQQARKRVVVEHSIGGFKRSAINYHAFVVARRRPCDDEAISQCACCAAHAARLLRRKASSQGQNTAWFWRNRLNGSAS